MYEARVTTTRSFTFEEGNSRKFWEVSTNGSALTVRFGRIGTDGQTQLKSFSSPDAAQAEAAKLIGSKLKKGYVEGGAAPKAVKAAKVAKAGPTKKVDAKSLVRAIELGLVPKAKQLVKPGVDVNVTVTQKYGVKTTPLLAAVQKESYELVDLLLNAGASLKVTDTYGRAPLHITQDVKLQKRLLEAGADVKERAKSGFTPLHAAATENALESVELLIAHGADLEARDERKRTPYAAASSREVRQLLKKHGARGLDATNGHALKPKSRKGTLDEVEVDDHALGVDAAGNVWFAGHVGLQRWDGKSLTIFEFVESFAVDRIFAGVNGLLFFSTNWGIVTFDGKAWRLVSSSDSELHDNHITDFAVDRKGLAYALGYGREKKVDRPISRYDGTGVTVLSAGLELPKGLEINTVAFDAKNQLVFATKKGVRFPNGKLWAPGDRDVANVIIDGETTWADCGYFGLFRQRAGKTRKFDLEEGVNTLCLAGKTMWVGNSGGLHRIDGDALAHVGLADDGVEELALGRDGTVWINSGSKLFSVKADGIVRSLDGKPVSATQEEEEAVVAPKKARKLAALPTKAFIDEAKLPKEIAKALAVDVAGLPLARFVRPAIGFEVGKPVSAAVGASKLGGRPDLADGKWPAADGEALPFLLQISLADVTAFDLEGLLPKKGLLSLFCETVPDELEASAVRFTTAKTTRAEWPEELEDRKDEDDFVAQLPDCALSFYGTWTLPSFEYLSRYAELSDQHRDALDAVNEALHAKDPKGSSTTRLLGWPVTLQGEIVESGDTVILIQLDGSMKAPKGLAQVFSQWGEGMAHVLISAKDLAAQKFENAEATLAFT